MITPSLARSAAKTHVDFISGPVRIKDALYMGDELAARDMDFIASNKVTHIINTVVKRIPNLYQRFGIQYLSVNWTEKETNIFDKKNNAINMIYSFIEEAMEQGESVLVHSLHGKSRSGSVIIAYLMKKYSWSLQKTFDYVVSKKDSFKIRSHFMAQLNQLEKRLAQTQTLSSGWNTATGQEDLVLANTLKNAKIIASTTTQEPRKNKKKISWGEKRVIGPQTKPQSHNILTSTSKYQEYRYGLGIKKLRSILKNSGQADQPTQQQKKQVKNLDSIQISPYRNNKNTDSVRKPNQSWNQEQKLAKSQVIGGKVVNHGHVVMNNFMGGGEKPKNQRYSSIPIRDTKDREKKLESKSGSRLAPYQNIISSIKSPYDINFLNKIGQNQKSRKPQSREYARNYNAQQRPQSVNLQQNQRSGSSKIFTPKPTTKQELLYASSYNYKNRGAWPTQRQNVIRYK